MVSMDYTSWMTMLFMTITMSEASVLEFSVKDVFMELTAWGSISVGRYNVNATDPFSRHIDGSLTTIDIKEITLLDSSHHIIRTIPLRNLPFRVFSITQWQGSQYWNIGASGRSMEATDLKEVTGTIRYRGYIFTEDGITRHGSTEYLVKAGDARVDIDLEDMMTCAVCHDVAFIELSLGVKGNNGLAENVHMYGVHQSTRIEVPGSTILYVNEQVKLDGHVIEMADGYPEIETEASHVEVIARLPRFSKSASYGFFMKPDRRDPKYLKDKMPTRAQDLNRYTTARTLINTEKTNDKKRDSESSQKVQSHNKPAAAVDTSGQNQLGFSLHLLTSCVLAFLAQFWR
jgi:hypothetical protein